MSTASVNGNRPDLEVGEPDRLRSASGADLFPTRALSRFVASLSGITAPVVVDLGQATGLSVTFLGEQLGCKLHIEDLLWDLETWVPYDDCQDSVGDEPSQEELSIKRRVLGRGTGSVNGILCWDIFDYLESDAARVLAREIDRVLSPGGVVFLCHAAEQCQISVPIQYGIVNDTTLCYRASRRVLPPRQVRQSRTIAEMFANLKISDSYLLTNRMREVLFRKPGSSTAVN